MQTSIAEWTLPGLHDALIQNLPELNLNASILDIGCGTGAWLERLSNLGFKNLHGIDLNTQYFQTGKATCSQADLDHEDLNLGNQGFDLITCIEVIEHLENPGRLFYHVSRCLNPNGCFLITTPNIYALDSRLKFFLTGNLKSFDSKGNQDHTYPVLLTSLERVLPRSNLKLEKQWSYPAKGSMITRNSTKLISASLEKFIPNDYPGDSLCFLIKSKKQ